MIEDKLREIRKQQHLTQKEAAEKIGVHEKTLKNWERGNPPSLDHLKEICKALHVSSDYLLSLDKLHVVRPEDYTPEEYELLSAMVQSAIQLIESRRKKKGGCDNSAPT